MSFPYKWLTGSQQAELRRQREQSDQEQVTDEMRRAWEAEHYAHSLQLAKATTWEEQAPHRDAMVRIEAALRKGT